MVVRERIVATCTVFLMNTKYYARENCCNGFDSGPKDTAKEAGDYAIGQLVSGGLIVFKDIQVPDNLTSYGPDIVIQEMAVRDGVYDIRWYSNDKQIASMRDGPVVGPL